MSTVGEFSVKEPARRDLVHAHLQLFDGRSPASRSMPKIPSPARSDPTGLSGNWMTGCTYKGEYADAVMRSLMTLKAMTYRPSGGIVAAVTTSLPESIGGVRNWDYRYCWLRDTSFTLLVLMLAGYRDEAIEPGASGYSAPSPAIPPRCRPSTASAASANCRSGRPTGFRATRTRSPVNIGNGGVRPVPARCLRRGRRCARPHARRPRTTSASPPSALQAAADQSPLRCLGAARRRHLGGPRTTPPLRPLQGYGLGRGGPRDQAPYDRYGHAADRASAGQKVRAEIHA